VQSLTARLHKGLLNNPFLLLTNCGIKALFLCGKESYSLINLCGAAFKFQSQFNLSSIKLS